MLFLGLIIAVIILAVNNNKLTKKNEEYRSLLIKNGLLKEEVITSEGEVLVKVKPEDEEELVPVKPVEKSKPKVIKEKPKYSDKEIKNSSILIVGSILVVLSALIFVMLGVFYGASAIAKKIKLNQTYKAFHYITLAYIPITLLSLCVFDLIGSYLSWGGDGDTLYLAICSLIVTAIYYIDSKDKNSKLIGIFSILFLMLGILFTNIYFDTRFETLLFSIVLLGVVFTVLHKTGNYYINESINKIGLYIIMFGTLAAQLLAGLVILLFGDVILLGVVDSLLIIYLLYYGAKMSKHEKAFFAVYPLLFASACLNMTGLVEQTALKEAIMLFSFIAVALYDTKRFKKITDSTYYELLGCSVILYIFTLFGDSIPSYFVLLAFLGITLLYHLNDPKTYKLYFTAVITHMLLVNVVTYYDWSMVTAGYVILVSLVLSLLYKSEFTKILRYTK